MTADSSIDPAGFLAEHLERAEPDLLRAMLKTFVEALMAAEAEALCNVPYRARRAERTNARDGLSGPGVGHPGRHHRGWRPQAAGRLVLPGLAA
jgi:hypothetical protein